MPKTALEQWDETAGNNTDIDSINIDEGCAPSGMNNAARATMAQIAKWIGDDTLASAATTDLGSVPGRYINITGTTTITAFGTIKAGTIKYLKFAGALTLTHNATSLILFSGQNITTYAGLTMIFVSEGSGNWRELSHTTATGTYLPVVSFNSASVGITYTTQTGRWWRLGKTVSVEIYIVLSSKGSSGGPAAVSLPFAKESGQVGTAPVGLQVNFSGLTAGITGYINSAASTILLRAPSTTGSASVTDTNFTNTSEFSMFASYQVA